MKIKHNPEVLLILFVGLLLSSIILTGCARDPGFGIFGTIYEWKDAPPNAVSKIYITEIQNGKDIDPTIKSMQENILRSIPVAPLEGAEVEVWDSYSRKYIDGGFICRTTSNFGGDFEHMNMGGPGPDPSITVTKLGYMEVTGKLDPRKGYLYIIVAVLVRQQ
jgi:hypothetical protein